MRAPGLKNRWQHSAALVLLAAAVLIVSLRFCSKESPQPSAPVRVPPTSAPAKVLPKAPAPSAKRRARLSEHYDFSPIERQMRQSRRDFALCFLASSSRPPARMKATFFWEGNGRFQKLEIQPAVGQQVQDCLKKTVQAWQIAPHPALQPFSYSRPLVLSGP